ncbi:tRNA (adenine(58)-N(1))-methyltransferase, mitochondrial [Collichthys lucidus]|uniref:tRNA (adenine(58)-N(1))-methyltransferase n=1 Tax=Collichthys lucidus TaxID=240159 RepID=A0A4U5VE84_COLLU|nr:tRNA (adenine(58)-N(1))-methyltransferase, mitochondrial [Collichthys lucidus]
MAVQMPFAGLLHRLLRISTCSQRLLCNRGILAKLHKCRREVRTFSTGSVTWNQNEGDDPESSSLSTKLTSRQALLSRRRRSLSPLERISGLLPQDALSPEVMQLREQNQQDVQVPVTHCTPEESGLGESPKEDDSENHHAAVEPHTQETSATLPGESLLAFGEQLVAEYRRKGRLEFRKMFQLQAGTRLQSSWGTILHDDIAGQPAGRFLKTGRGVPILIRRASLEDYVLFMKRGPAIAYPKDACTMLMMMDVTEGDCVLESGSGSGAMSLFLSRAVGSKGSVVSVEIREDHHKRAVLNYNRWRTSWSLRRGEEWPDNVQFHKADLCTASPLLAGRGFHAVMDLLEGLRCSALPLLCEHIIEVSFRNWLVAPALQKDGGYCIRKAPILHEDQRDETSDETDKGDFKVTPALLFMFLSTPFSLEVLLVLFQKRRHQRRSTQPSGVFPTLPDLILNK